MYEKKSNKGQERGPYRKYDMGFDRYVAEVFGNRMNDLGLSQYALSKKNEGKITQPTLSRVLKGHGGTSINTLALIADMLGLDIIIKPKKTDTDNEDNN